MYDMDDDDNVEPTDDYQCYPEGIVARIYLLSAVPDLMTWFLEIKDRDAFAEAVAVMAPARGFDAERCAASIGDLFDRAVSVCVGTVPGAPVVIEFDVLAMTDFAEGVERRLTTAERIAYVDEVRAWAQGMGVAVVEVRQAMKDGVALVLRDEAGEDPHTVRAYWG